MPHIAVFIFIPSPEIRSDLSVPVHDKKIKVSERAGSPDCGYRLIWRRAWHYWELQLPQLVIGTVWHIRPDVECVDEVHSCSDIKHIPVLATDIYSLCEERLG